MNLLLISIDSLRYDYVSRTNSDIVCPRFDALTRDFHFMGGCFSVSSATRPVHVSLLSGLYPFEHGIISQRHTRQRRDMPLLFEVCQKAGFSCSGLSEAADIFQGLDLGVSVDALYPQPEPGVASALQRIRTRRGRQCLFLHYWSTHTPYGATDRRATGETEDLLKAGNLDRVLDRYRHCVKEVFEYKLAPILEEIDLSEWIVVILGDHGESWTAEEPYHGVTLNNSVLRVPLFLHVPFQAHSMSPRESVFSLIDLFPTLCDILELQCDYRGYGRSIGRPRDHKHKYLAQIVPLDARRGDIELIATPNSEHDVDNQMVWSLFDDEQKFTYDEKSRNGRLQETFTERTVESITRPETVSAYVAEYNQLLASSAYSWWMDSPGLDPLLDQRLRDLGYL